MRYYQDVSGLLYPYTTTGVKKFKTQLVSMRKSRIVKISKTSALGATGNNPAVPTIKLKEVER